MFSSSSTNPYDAIVVKATDENQTSENWEVIISLCDKVQDEGEIGARNVIAAILKRLAHRTANVQLYALSLAEALSKNCDIKLHQELASRPFTQGIEKLIADRNTHDKVRKRALGLIQTWALEFQDNPSLGVMDECYANLKAKHYKFENDPEPPPPDVDDDIRRKEEEELQRVLELSMNDKGGRSNWVASYPEPPSSSSAGPSSSRRPLPTSEPPSEPSPYSSGPYQAGYTPSAKPAVAAMSAVPPSSTPVPASHPQPVRQPSLDPASDALAHAKPTVISRVRALHTFEPTEQGELGFEKGDVIKVVDRGYKDWWRGQLRGKTGIFPVNYVEPIPEPTPNEIAQEAQQEASIFAQAAAIDQLLDMLKKVDPLKDNLADNEEIQELYRSSMTLRPKIVKLIDRYSQKRADLVSMNESFVKARRIFDQMMEESLAKHNPGAAIYEYPRQPMQHEPRPDSRARLQSEYGPPAPGGRPPVPSTYGWNPAMYGGALPPQSPHPQPQSHPYPPQSTQLYPTQPPQTDGQPQYGQSYGPDPYATSQQRPYQPPQGPGAPVGPTQQVARPTTMYDPTPADHSSPAPFSPYINAPQGQPIQSPHLAGVSAPGLISHASSFNVGQSAPPTAAMSPGPSQNPPQPLAQLQQQEPQHPYAQATPQPLAQLQQQEPQHAYPQNAQILPTSEQPEAQGVPVATPPTELDQGPPYPFDPARVYPDENVNAWRDYYARGGTSGDGKVYFILSTLPPHARGDDTPTNAVTAQPAEGLPHGAHPSTSFSPSDPNLVAQNAAGQGYNVPGAYAPGQENVPVSQSPHVEPHRSQSYAQQQQQSPSSPSHSVQQGYVTGQPLSQNFSHLSLGAPGGQAHPAQVQNM